MLHPKNGQLQSCWIPATCTTGVHYTCWSASRRQPNLHCGIVRHVGNMSDMTPKAVTLWIARGASQAPLTHAPCLQMVTPCAVPRAQLQQPRSYLTPTVPPADGSSQGLPRSMAYPPASPPQRSASQGRQRPVSTGRGARRALDMSAIGPNRVLEAGSHVGQQAAGQPCAGTGNAGGAQVRPAAAGTGGVSEGGATLGRLTLVELWRGV